MSDVCSDNRFEMIRAAKAALLESTNIEDSQTDMAALDSILYRCWQMGWLGRETCHDANTRFDAWTCSVCKCTLLLMFDDYGEPALSVDGVASVPNHCPNCGRRVIDDRQGD